ncbi:MAG: peptidoglycan DD-metalloendopeptidase family protein [Rhizonema sp. PD37]|nr:peptidoglycan DD-metalloendopeptidase family protein [Rhizonema sp. PD37]
MEITTKIARCQIGDDVWFSGDDILMDAIAVHLGEDKSASTCSFSIFDPEFLIAAKYRKISIREGGIIVDAQLLGKGVQQDSTPDNVPNTNIGTPTPSPQGTTKATSAAATGPGVQYKGFPPEISAWLDVIAFGEVSDKLGPGGYNSGNGNQKFYDFSRFPRGAGRNCGRYQTSADEYGEWLATNPPIKDFSPQAQDIFAKFLMDRRHATAFVLQHDIANALRASMHEWASILNPDTGYSYYNFRGQEYAKYGGTPQPVQLKTVGAVTDYFNQRLAYYQSQASGTPQTPVVDNIKLNQVAATMQPTKPDVKQLKTAPAPIEDSKKGVEIIISLMVGTSDFKQLVDFHFIHVGTDSSKQLGREITTFSGKSLTFLLSRVPQNLTHSDITLKQFADKICKQYGLKLVMDGDGLAYHYLPQTGETPFQVLERECRKIGFRIADNPRSKELIIEPYARPKFTEFSVDEETLIEAKFSDKASATPRYIPGAIASMPETQGSASKTSINQQSGALSQSQADNKVGAGSKGGVTGVQSPAAGGIPKVFGVTLNKLAEQQQQQSANKRATAPQTEIKTPPIVTTKTINKADGTVAIIETLKESAKQYLKITDHEVVTTKIQKPGESTPGTTTTKETVTIYTDKDTTVFTQNTDATGKVTSDSQTSSKVNNAVLATKTIPQTSGVVAASGTGGNVDDATGLPKVTPGAIALDKDGMVQGEALTNEKSRIKLYEGSLTLRTTEDILKLIPGEIIGLSGRLFPPEFATEVRVSDINHDFASAKSMLNFYTPGLAQTDTPPSVPNTSINQKTNTPAPPVPASSSGLILPMQPLQGVGDGVGFIPSRGRKHKGVDIRAPLGTPVVASGDGLVVDTVTECVVGDIHCGGDWGNQVILALKVPSTGETIYHRYAHLKQGSIVVQKGQTVKQGQQVAQCGTTGHSSGPHLHFENRRGNPFADYFPPSTFGIKCPQGQAGQV